MKLYKLPVILREPSEETEDKYLAEVPALPGCRAWGDTAAQALESVQSVAATFIESYNAKGDLLPQEVQDAARDVVGGGTQSEVLVAV